MMLFKPGRFRSLLIPIAAGCCLIVPAQEIKDPNPPPGMPDGIHARATGGPDGFGYVWDDGVPFQEIDISGTGAFVILLFVSIPRIRRANRTEGRAP